MHMRAMSVSTDVSPDVDGCVCRSKEGTIAIPDFEKVGHCISLPLRIF